MSSSQYRWERQLKTLENINGDFDIKNGLLLSLRPEALGFIRDRMALRRLTAGQVLCSVDEVVTQVIFPHRGVVSLLRQGAQSVETASIGPEGYLGFGWDIGDGRAAVECVVQVSGYASWISVGALRQAGEEFPCVRDALLRYSACLNVQLLETVACLKLHNAEQIISRWLLDANDRVSGESFQITQSSLSQLLGFGRPTVNLVCSSLMGRGALEYSRGNVSISDLDVLEAVACDCYRRIKNQFGQRGYLGSDSARGD